MYVMLFDHCPQEGLTKGQFMYLPISVDECLTSSIENCKINNNIKFVFTHNDNKPLLDCIHLHQMLVQ